MGSHRLNNQVMLITGGASGLGQAIVERFLNEGACVAVLDRSEQAIASLQTQGVDWGFEDQLCTIQGDVRSYQDNALAVERCLGAFGRLDCAIGNAGIWDFSKALVDIPADQLDQSFDEMFQINVKGYLHLAKAAMKALASSRGSLIYTVSNAGFYPDGGGALYTATKHAVVGLVKQLAFEFAPYIRVNGVAPGAIDTNLTGAEALGMSERIIPGAALSRAIPDIAPLGLMPTPAEYAGAYVFFASREDNIPATGVVLNHDGGMGVRGFVGPRGGDKLAEKLGLTESNK